MEELLNKLIEKGWRPRGYEKIYKFGIEKGFTVSQPQTKKFIGFATKSVWTEDMNEPAYTDYRAYTIRELVSKESGLWQFCVENNLVKLIENHNKDKLPRDRMSEEEYRMWEYNVYYSFSNKKDIHKRYEQGSLTYRLIESALCDEDKLEDFLLNNIKEEGN